ncbi:hypothetical protein BDR22DRAFT_884317 [Usnea florida]
MSPTLVSEYLIRGYAVAALQDVYILNDHGLFEGDDILGQDSTEDLYDEANTPSGQNCKPIAQIPIGHQCPRCAEQGIEQYVLPGKHCPRCNHPC